jgi:hypothetical protein
VQHKLMPFTLIVRESSDPAAAGIQDGDALTG